MRRTKEQAEQTRQAIIQSALCLFAEQGYNRTAMNHIALRAGVTRGAVYWHFENKKQILQVLADDNLQPVLQSTQSALSEQKQGWQLLETSMSALFSEMLRNPKRQQFFRIMQEQFGATEDIREIGLQYDTFFQTQSALLAEMGKREGKIAPNLSSAYVHLHLTAMMKGLVLCYLHHEHLFSEENALQTIRRTMQSFHTP